MRYAHWVERAKARGEIAPVVPPTAADAFIDRSPFCRAGGSRAR